MHVNKKVFATGVDSKTMLSILDKTKLPQHNKLFPGAVVLLYIAGGAFLMPFFRYQINPDGISYIGVAQKYLHGNFHDAINGHTYPMISWLLVPLLALKIEPLLATKILNLITGAAIIINLYLLSCVFSLGPATILILLASSVPVVLYFTFHVITPDMLLTAIILTYVLITSKKDFAENRTDGVLCGLLGGIGYLTKSYFLPFFYCHFLLVSAFHFLKKRKSSGRKLIFFNAITGILTCVFISGLWIAALSAKYEKIMITSQGSVVFSVISPHPHIQKGFIPPPNKTAVSIWEDPRDALKNNTWNPFGSYDDLIFWLKVIKKNIITNIGLFFHFSPLAFFICTGCCLLLLRRPKQIMQHEEIIYMLLTGLMYGGGYCLSITEERYMWPLFLLFIITTNYMLTIFVQHRHLKRLKYIFLIICGLSFTIMPLTSLYKNINTGKAIYLLGKKMEKYIPPGSRLASNTDWYNSLFLAYHLKASIYGSGDNLSIDELKDELNKYSIHYFLVWKNRGSNYPFLSADQEITHGAINELLIYKLPSQALP